MLEMAALVPAILSAPERGLTVTRERPLPDASQKKALAALAARVGETLAASL
jgi:hypothetical protein